MEIAQWIADELLTRLGLGGKIRIEKKAIYVIAAMSPRLMKSTVEKLVANAVYSEAGVIAEEQVWREVDAADQPSLLH